MEPEQKDHEQRREHPIARWLRAHDHDQAWLCRITGLDDGVVSSLLAGRRRPSVTRLGVLVRATGGDVDAMSIVEWYDQHYAREASACPRE